MTTGVIIPKGLSTTETLKQRVCSQDHVLDLLNATILPSRHSSDILHNALCSFCFACAGFPRYNDALIVGIGFHVVIGRLRDTKDMWRDFKAVLALVPLQNIIGIYAQIYCPVRLA